MTPNEPVVAFRFAVDGGMISGIDIVMDPTSLAALEVEIITHFP